MERDLLRHLRKKQKNRMLLPPPLKRASPPLSPGQNKLGARGLQQRLKKNQENGMLLPLLQRMRRNLFKPLKKKQKEGIMLRKVVVVASKHVVDVLSGQSAKVEKAAGSKRPQGLKVSSHREAHLLLCLTHCCLGVIGDPLLKEVILALQRNPLHKVKRIRCIIHLGVPKLY